MNWLGKLALVSLTLGLLLAPARARAQLYEDPAKDATKGDINSQDYWWTKFDMMMLDIALKQRQPEGRIGVALASTTKRVDDLAKKYPKHEEIAKWKKKVDQVLAKIDPNADRRTGFSPECPWEEANFAQLWVNLQWAQMQYDAKDYQNARGLMQNVMQNYEIMLKPDRMKDYPPELRKWVVDHKPEADKLLKKIKDKNG